MSRTGGRELHLAMEMGLAALVMLAVAPSALAEPAADYSAQAATASNTFAANLYAQLATEKGNLFFSPFSIDVALAMTYTGAKGDTAAQMAGVLHLPWQQPEFDYEGGAGKPQLSAVHLGPDPAVIEEGLPAILKDLNAEKGADGKPRGFQLSVANALWGQKGEAFLPDFLKTLKDNYGAGLSEVDFAADTDGARKTINAWVEKETQDKIKDLLKPGVLTPITRLVLTNAIYFKGNWAEQFKKDATQDASFTIEESVGEGFGGSGGFAHKALSIITKTATVPMMNRTGQYGYFEEESLQGLKLPYAGNELSMVILLPKKVGGLADLEKSASFDNLNAWMKKFHTQKVIVSIPKFKTTAEFELSKTLTAMGMKDAFDPVRADFSGMNGKKDLVISAVVHKAFVDVNEEGTEAAAATAVVMGRMAIVAERPTPVFRADHPFLFLIRHEKSGAILFMGRIVDPTK